MFQFFLAAVLEVLVKMAKILNFVLLTSIILSIGVVAENSFKLIGGEAVSMKLHNQLFKHHVAVRSHEELWWCGGSVINRVQILTAAHCVYNSTPHSLYIRAGSLNTTDGGVVRNVSNVKVHYAYNEVTYDSDLAMLVLEYPIEFTESIQPVKVANLSVTIYEEIGTMLTICGYGRSEYSNNDSLLRYFELPINDIELCKTQYEPYDDIITDNMFCVGNITMKFNTKGDSGGENQINSVYFK